jgi:hypothetical protein
MGVGGDQLMYHQIDKTKHKCNYSGRKSISSFALNTSSATFIKETIRQQTCTTATLNQYHIKYKMGKKQCLEISSIY